MHEPATYAVWMPHATTQQRVPLSVRSVGRYMIDPSWRERAKKKWFHQLFWVVSGAGHFLVDKEWVTAEANDIFFYRPGDVHDVRARSDLWIYCWVTWDHPDAGKWIEGFELKERVQQRGPCPQWLFQEIADRLSEGVPEGQRQAAHAAHAILLEASNLREREVRANPIAERARVYLDTNYHDTNLSISTVAESMGIHRTTLFRVFQNAYHVSPLHYLHNRRLERALALLHRSDLRINEAAQRSGFSDPSYFSRAVRRSTGMSPREFRASPRMAHHAHRSANG